MEGLDYVSKEKPVLILVQSDTTITFCGALTIILINAGFEKIRIRSMFFGHVRFPTFFQHVIDAMDCPMRVLPPFRLFAQSINKYRVVMHKKLKYT